MTVEGKKAHILKELWKIAFADFTQAVKVVDGAAVPVDTKEMPPSLRGAVSAIKEGTKGVEVKFYDKLRALEILYKLLDDDHQDGDDLTVILKVVE